MTGSAGAILNSQADGVWSMQPLRGALRLGRGGLENGKK